MDNPIRKPAKLAHDSLRANPAYPSASFLGDQAEPAPLDLGRMEHGRLSRLYRLLSSASAAIFKTSDREQLFACLNEILAESGLFSVACIAIIQPITGEIAPAASCCNPPHERSRIDALLAGVLVGHCAGTASTLRVVNDLESESDESPIAWRKEALAAGLRAFASLPIVAGDQFFGTIVVFADTADGFDDEVIDLLRQLAESVSYVLRMQDESIERHTYELGLAESRRELRELIHYLHTVREDERSLMARELHDELGQTLNTLKLDLRALGNEQSLKAPAHALRMSRMTLAVDRALAEVHRIVTALCPRVLDDLGLGPAIEWLAGDFIDQSGIDCRLEMNLPQRYIPRIAATTAFRCVQECLTNISHHAVATSVTIAATLDGSLLKLVITDDGHAAAHSGPTADSFGHIGMRQRAELLGGRLKMQNRHERGTRIEIVLPVMPPEELSMVRHYGSARTRKPS